MRKTYEVSEYDGRFFVQQTNSRKRFGHSEGRFDTRQEANERLSHVEAREDERYAALLKRQQASRAADRAGKQALRARVDVGSVLATSWGYEQTNVEFYEVVNTHGAFGLTLRRIAAETVQVTGPFSDQVLPVPGGFTGEPFRKGLTSSGVRIHSSATARPVDPTTPRHRSWGY